MAISKPDRGHVQQHPQKKSIWRVVLRTIIQHESLNSESDLNPQTVVSSSTSVALYAETSTPASALSSSAQMTAPVPPINRQRPGSLWWVKRRWDGFRKNDQPALNVMVTLLTMYAYRLSKLSVLQCSAFTFDDIGWKLHRNERINENLSDIV